MIESMLNMFCGVQDRGLLEATDILHWSVVDMTWIFQTCPVPWRHRSTRSVCRGSAGGPQRIDVRSALPINRESLPQPRYELILMSGGGRLNRQIRRIRGLRE